MFLLNAGSTITNFDVLHYPERLSMKVGEIHNREPYYHANQAKAEDVANIVAGDTRSGAYSTQLIRTDAAIGGDIPLSCCPPYSPTRHASSTPS
jgi:hypothetical protein